MKKEYRKVNDFVQKCNIWDLSEFNEGLNPNGWKRNWPEKEFLKKIGTSSPKSYVIVAASGTSITIDDEPKEKEVYGVDVMRKKNSELLAVYHYPFYKQGEDIVMPTTPKKICKEHYVKNKEEFEEKHDESRNYKPEQIKNE